MITELRLQGFKRFDQSRAHVIPLAPITVLLGPNSAGKSTVLQALLLLRESLRDGLGGCDILRTTGPDLDLGRFGAVVHNQQPRPVPENQGLAPDLSLGVGFGDGSGVDLDFETPDWPAESEGKRAELPARGGLVRIREARRGAAGSGTPPYAWSTEPDGDRRLKLHADPDLCGTLLVAAKRQHASLDLPAQSDWSEWEKLVWEAAHADPPVVSLTAEVEGDVLKGVTIDEAYPNRDENAEVQPRFVSDSKEGKELASGLRDLIARRDDVAKLASALGLKGTNNLTGSLPYLTWIAPVRHTGERVYATAATKRSAPAPRGENLGAVLTEERLRSVNEWLKVLELPYELGNEPVGVATVLSELLLTGRVGDAAHHVGLPDVGSGVAQVLPVLAACAWATSSPEENLVILQQPELHLHPKQQASLADVFADTIGRRDAVANGEVPVDLRNQVIIETHSQTLVLALQCLIAEGRVRADEVSIIAFDLHLDGKLRPYRMELNDEGDLLSDWPGGFFPDAARLQRRKLKLTHERAPREGGPP